jgi:hypothetical protein
MDRRIQIAAVFLVLAGGFLALLIFGLDSDEEAINGRLDDLLELAEVSGSEGKLQSLATARRISGFFTRNCSVQILYDRSEIDGSEEITALAASLRAQSKSVSFSLRERNLTLGGGGDRAEMNLRIKVKIAGEESIDRGEGRFFLNWVKSDGQWLIDRVAIP